MLAIVDYGIGNVRSVLNAFDFLGIPAKLTRDAGEIAEADALVLPGVGAFGEGMRRIDEYGLRPALVKAFDQGKPMLGICLGFELLMRFSDEQGDHAGLNFFPLDVHRIETSARLPHIGWSAVHSRSSSTKPSRLMRGIEGEFFYFVHSYAVMPDSRFTTATASYGGTELVAVIEQGQLFGTQFHPEKSGEAGLQLLRNFAAVRV